MPAVEELPWTERGLADQNGYEMVEFLHSVSDDLPDGMDMDVTPYWDGELDTLYIMSISYTIRVTTRIPAAWSD